jgi:hypothetical protein
MMNNLKQNDVGGENIITETGRTFVKSTCENIMKEKEWKRRCPNCGKELTYSYQSGFSYARKYNTCCLLCSASSKNETSKYFKNCPECNTKMFFKTKIGLCNSLKFNTRCRKCISKKFPSPMKYLKYKFSKNHIEKIRQKMIGRDLGKKHSPEQVRKMIEGLVKMPYEKWIQICPEIIRYRKKVHHISRTNCKRYKIKNFGAPGYNMDHIFPVKVGFMFKIPEEIMSDFSNLRIIKEVDNKKKSSKITEIPNVIKPYYEKNSKN